MSETSGSIYDGWMYEVTGHATYFEDRGQVAGYSIRVFKIEGEEVMGTSIKHNVRIPESCDNVNQFIQFAAQRVVQRFTTGHYSDDIYMKPKPVGGL